MNRVLVTGLGCVSPIGCSIQEYWASLLAGRSGVRTLAFPALSRCRTRIGAQIVDFVAEDHFSRRELQRTSRSTKFALVAASEAITDASLHLDSLDCTRVAVVLGSSIGGFTTSESMFQQYFDGGVLSPLTVPLVMNNAPASNISIHFGFTGPVITIDTACSSSAHALGYALTLIRLGVVDIAITGGTDCALSPGVIHAWSSLRALSERNESPAEACRPFSRDRDGMVLGEGAGILILESEATALQRKAHIYAEVKGYGANSDGHHITQPSIEGISKAMQLALQDAQLAANDIDYINAHATATQWNDKIETAGIKNLFGDKSHSIPVVGIKPAIGHSIAASASLEAISCVLSIRDSVIPQTLNQKVPDPDCDLDYVPDGPRHLSVNHIMSNAFAFGGSNAVIILSKYMA